MIMRRAILVWVLLTAALVTAPRAEVQDGDLPVGTLLQRVGEYLTGFATAYAQVVAEEQYTQTMTPKKAALGLTRAEVRVISADVVAVSDSTRTWLNFRDVFAVDHRPVRDRDERLTKLFLAAPGAGEDSLARAGAIADESARFNLGSLSRNVNFPAMVLNFLTPARLAGLRVRRDRREKVSGVETVVLAFTEVARPTVVRSGRLDVPAQGRLWVEPGTGRLMKTRLEFEGKDFSGESTVTYGFIEKLGLWLPVAMTDKATGAREVVAGRAGYANFRRFGTSAVIK